MSEVDNHHVPKVVQGVAAYQAAFEQGGPVKISESSDLRGRILRGREASPGEFDSLGLPERELVFIMGPDCLSELPGLSLSQAFGRIGLMPDYIVGRIAQGYSFKLAVFHGGADAPSATWDNALDMVGNCHPALAPDIEVHRELFKRTPPQEFVERMLPEDFDQIELAGPSHPAFMTTERYFALSQDTRHEAPLPLRRWLAHTGHIGITFRGDGYTQTTEGERGIKEYLMPNQPIANLRNAVVIDLPLE